MRKIGRRRFLSMAAFATAAPAFATPASAAIRVGEKSLALMPQDFNGLSYESTQLYNPDFFSPKNEALVEAFRRLSKHGVLRLGGYLSNSSRWQSENGRFETPEQTAIITAGQTAKWEWKLCDATVQAHRDGAITPQALTALRGFCDATGWRVIYGLDCTAGGPERARDEGAHVAAALGDRLICFQVANEADFLPQYKRDPNDRVGVFDPYLRDYLAFVEAVRAVVPQAPFGGPDTALDLEWVADYAKRIGKDAVLLSSHLYAMGPGTDPSQNAQLLLSGKSRLPDVVAAAQAATAVAGVPFRLTEINSCFRGGRPDVSDAFASALWAADMMLHTASAGFAGVNLHGGGDGYYTPIETAKDGGTLVRPVYYGMQFAEMFAGTEMLPCDVQTAANVSAYAARKGKSKMLALINKGPETVPIAQNWVKPGRMTSLTAPGLDAKKGIALTTAPVNGAPPHRLPAYSAMILTG